jgi:hypothetical protein
MIEKAWLCENLETKVVNEGAPSALQAASKRLS